MSWFICRCYSIKFIIIITIILFVQNRTSWSIQTRFWIRLACILHTTVSNRIPRHEALSVLQVPETKPNRPTNKKLIRRWDTRTWLRSIFLPLLPLTSPTEGFPWDDLRKILHGGQRMAKVKTGEKYCRKFQPPRSRAHECYRRQTDDRRICDDKDPNVTYVYSHVRIKTQIYAI